MKTPLWKLEHDFYEKLLHAYHKAKYDKITVGELLELGFNNNYLDTLTGRIELGYVDEYGHLSEDLTEEQLNVKIKMKEDFGIDEDYCTDLDGYHIAVVECVNHYEENFFRELMN